MQNYVCLVVSRILQKNDENCVMEAQHVFVPSLTQDMPIRNARRLGNSNNKERPMVVVLE